MVEKPEEGGDITAEEDQEGRGWTPSRSPTHRAAPKQVSAASGIVVTEENVGFLRALLRRPFVRLVIGLALFTLGAIVYESTVNYRQWTERQEKQKATKHKGLAPVAKTPDDVPEARSRQP